MFDGNHRTPSRISLAYMSTNDSTAKRVKFDFEVDFSNGGGMQGQDFRLDLAGDDISDAALAQYLVADLRLLMVKEVRILRKEIFTEKHKRVKIIGENSPHRFIDVSHAVEHGMITYKGLPDDTDDGHRPVHTTLLGADIPIVEHLCDLAQLPDTGFRFFATPVKVRGCGTFPVRAFGTAERYNLRRQL